MESLSQVAHPPKVASSHIKIGVTGTKGKTTTTFLIRSILREAGFKTGLIGSLEYDLGDGTLQHAYFTTPAKQMMNWIFGKMDKRGVAYSVFELASFSFSDDRLSFLKMDCEIITGIMNGYHIDPKLNGAHKNFEEYKEAKLKTLDHVKHDGFVVINYDTDYLPEILKRATCRQVAYGFSPYCDTEYSGRPITNTIYGNAVELNLRGHRITVLTPLVGTHQVSNLLAAASMCSELGVSPEVIKCGIQRMGQVPARIERIATFNDIHVFLDICFTVNGLSSTISSLRYLMRDRGRIIVVMGATRGGRSSEMRRKFGAYISELVDMVIITQDNPQGENIHEISEIVQDGAHDPNRVRCIEEREEAIQFAINEARPGDVVLLAGRGIDPIMQMTNNTVNIVLDAVIARDAVRRIEAR